MTTNDAVLFEIERAMRSPIACYCGSEVVLVVHDDAAWLECPRLTEPTRLPRALAAVARSLGHLRRFVVELPEADVAA